MADGELVKLEDQTPTPQPEMPTAIDDVDFDRLVQAVEAGFKIANDEVDPFLKKYGHKWEDLLTPKQREVTEAMLKKLEEASCLWF